MPFYFTTPTVEEGPAGDNYLHYRYKLTRGVTVIKNGATYTETRYPFQEDLEAADAYYLGGRTYEVTATEKASLEAAGYTVQTV